MRHMTAFAYDIDATYPTRQQLLVQQMLKTTQHQEASPCLSNSSTRQQALAMENPPSWYYVSKQQ